MPLHPHETAGGYAGSSSRNNIRHASQDLRKVVEKVQRGEKSSQELREQIEKARNDGVAQPAIDADDFLKANQALLDALSSASIKDWTRAIKEAEAFNATAEFTVEISWVRRLENAILAENLKDLKQAFMEAKQRLLEVPAAAVKLKELEEAAETDKEAAERESDIHEAAESGNLPALRYLLDEEGKRFDACDYDGTLLHAAARNGHRDIVQVLLARRACVSEKDYKRNTPLHLAAYHCKLEVVKLLIEWNAPLEARDMDGLTPLQVAKENDEENADLPEHLEIVKLLEA